MGAFIISPLPPMLLEEIQTAGLLRSTDITPLRRYYQPLRDPLVVSRLPGVAGYTTYPASAVSGRDEEGFSSCLMCPWHHAIANHPAGATRRFNRSATNRAAFAIRLQARPPGFLTFGATSRSLTLWPGVSHPSRRWVCRWASGQLVSRLPAIPATGLPIVTLAGLTPAEHISLPGHTTGREPLGSSGSYCPVAGRIPIRHNSNRFGSRRATRPSQ
jgi:hypothetical protein